MARPGAKARNRLISSFARRNGLSGEVERKGIVDGRHHLIVSGFDLAQIRALLEQYATASAANTWKEAAFKLSRLGKWEFEDYDPKQ
jgi:hypothetical protein